MARKDQLTGKGPMTGNKRSHAMNHSRREWGVNLQKVTVVDDMGQAVTLKVSAKTKKTILRKGLFATPVITK